MGARHLEHGHGQVGVQDDRHHGGDEWKPIAADHSGCHVACTLQATSWCRRLEHSREKMKRVVEQHKQCGHVLVPHRKGNWGLDVRLIQPRRFFMFTFIIVSNT